MPIESYKKSFIPCYLVWIVELKYHAIDLPQIARSDYGRGARGPRALNKMAAGPRPWIKMAAGSAEQAHIVDFTDIHSAREQLSCTVRNVHFIPYLHTVITVVVLYKKNASDLEKG